MKKILGILVALTLASAAVVAQPTAIVAQPICESIVFIDGTTAYECYCNFGTNCTPPAGVPHCTQAQCSVEISG
jgi:hypothetical protein